jgi:hypothetical protein
LTNTIDPKEKEQKKIVKKETEIKLNENNRCIGQKIKENDVKFDYT